MGLPLCFIAVAVRDRACSPAVGVNALWVGLNQAPFPLSGALPPKEVIAEASEAHVLTKDQYTTSVGI